jgi:hypothetical protein
MRPDLGSILRVRAPREVVIQITDRCNAACPQCAMRQGAGFVRSTMATDTALSAISRAAAAGVSAVAFTGGESLLDVTQISRYVRYARQRGIPITRTGTNGYLFAGADTRQAAAQAARLADVLASAGLNTLSIGLDCADPATHEATRGLPGVVAGIERALPVFHEAGLYPTARREDDLGQYAALDYGCLERVPHCRRCDWERFRDPSELFGPVAGLPRLAVTAARSIEGRDRRLRLWRQDVRYALAAGFFDGRRPPDPTRLGAFAPPDAAPPAAASPAPASEPRRLIADHGAQADVVRR